MISDLYKKDYSNYNDLSILYYIEEKDIVLKMDNIRCYFS